MQKQLDFWLLAILGLGLLLRLPYLNGSFWLDEAAQALESIRPFSQQLDIAADFQPPLLHYLVHFATYIGRAEWWLRTIGALIPGLLTLAFTYLIGKNFFSKTTGIVASLLLATSSLHIFYSQELRPYSLPALWATLSWYAVIKLQVTLTATKKISYVWLAILLMSSVLGLYSSYLYPFLFAAQMFYLVVTLKKYWLHWIGVGVAVTAFFLPWLPHFQEQLVVGQSWRSEYPGWEQVVSYDQFKSVALTIGKFIYGVVNLDISIVFIVTTILLLAMLTYLAWQYFRSDFVGKNQTAFAFTYGLLANKPVVALLVWLVIPFLLAWLVSWWIPVIQPKRLLLLLPVFYLLIAEFSLHSPSRSVGYTMVGIFLALNIFSTSSYYVQPQLQRENWRALHQELVQRYPSDDTVAVFAFNEPFAPWRWYDQGTVPTLSTGQLVITPEFPIAEQLKSIQEYSFVITFEYLADLSDPTLQVPQFVQNLGYTQIEILTYPNIGQVYVWSKPSSSLSLHKGLSTTLQLYAGRH